VKYIIDGSYPSMTLQIGSPGDYSLEGWADDLVAFCDTVGIDKPIVLGNSAGGIWHQMDHLEAISSITCPTLVLAGAHDPVTPIQDSEDMVQRLGPSIVTHVPFENAGKVAAGPVRGCVRRGGRGRWSAPRTRRG